MGPTEVTLNVFSILLFLAYVICGYYLLCKKRSRQPKLILIWAIFTVNNLLLVITTLTDSEFYLYPSARSVILTTLNFFLNCMGHWLFSSQYFISLIEIKSAVEDRPQQFKNKICLTWTGVALIFLFLCLVNFQYFFSNYSNSVWAMMLSLNLAVDLFCGILITFSMIILSGIASKVPFHLKKD